MQHPSFTIGIEEEYLLVDPETRDLVRDPPADVMDACEQRLGTQVGSEFLRTQIEVGTKVSPDIPTVAADLTHLRTTVCDVAEEFGMSLIAASTHPFADWSDQQITEKDRYRMLARDLQVVARRLVICGMHVHVGIEEPDVRIDLMNQVSYFLPHLLALSTSSPFWNGVQTGLKSYRMSVFYSLPRTGLPEQFSSWSEYERHVAVLVNAGLIEDATKLWWDIRPSARYPTVEMRIADICTRLEDGVAVAALYVSLLRVLYRRRLENQRWRTYVDMLVSENIWRAQRFGVHDSMVDFGRGELVPYSDLLDELIELVAEEATETGCLDQVKHARSIVTGGTSSDRQVEVYEAALGDGATDREALQAVVDHLIVDTRHGI